MAGLDSLVVESDGNVWLFTLGPQDAPGSAGTVGIAKVCPIPRILHLITCCASMTPVGRQAVLLPFIAILAPKRTSFSVASRPSGVRIERCVLNQDIPSGSTC